MEKYWIGSIGRAFFVFDPDIQTSVDDDVTLFSYSHDRPVKLNKSIVKLRIKKLNSEDVAKDILKRYINWKQFYRSELFLINESPTFDTPKFIASAQSGAIRASWGRKAYCYACGSALYGKRGNICEQCFWVECSCGACGCGWSR